jgi:hypothetical protein
MSRRTTAALGTIVLTTALSAFTGSALAGNGNGNGGGAGSQAAPAGQSGSHGNSASAPGQTKKDQASTIASPKGSASQNTATSAGLKPTSATSKNQWAPASSNRTKRYGNGTTAGQIATQAGAGSSMLYGPGNSQPHKVGCNGHLIDVHALKAHATACSSSTTSATTHTSTSTPTTVTKVITAVTSHHGSAVGHSAKGSAASTGAAAGGVLGATAKASSGKGPGFGGVLGAVASVGHGTLPFTGFPLWAAAVVGLMLVLGGLTVARFGRATV